MGLFGKDLFRALGLGFLLGAAWMGASFVTSWQPAPALAQPVLSQAAIAAPAH